MLTALGFNRERAEESKSLILSEKLSFICFGRGKEKLCLRSNLRLEQQCLPENQGSSFKVPIDCQRNHCQTSDK